MKIYFDLISIAFVLFSLVSCSEHDDTKPSITVISPAENDTFLINDTIPFAAMFSDDDELSQYRLEVKNNFSVHADSFPGWNTIIVNNISGNEQTVSLEIPVEDSISRGVYLLIVKAVDASGNEAPADTTAITVQ